MPRADRPVRGGDQQIPRPVAARPGDPAPWAHLSPADRHVDLDRLRRAFAAAGPPVRSQREASVGRGSAVLAAIYEDDGEAHVVLTRRASALRVHGGEVSFPGGGQDPGEDLATTARREAHEEVDLDPESVDIFGQLDHLTTVTSNSFIVPFVAALPARPSLTPSPAEVAAVLLVPLSELLDPEVFHEERWELFGDARSIYFFELVGDTVWGATAAMLRQLLGLATGTVGRGELRHL